jgi:hypothetical protein
MPFRQRSGVAGFPSVSTTCTVTIAPVAHDVYDLLPKLLDRNGQVFSSISRLRHRSWRFIRRSV